MKKALDDDASALRRQYGALPYRTSEDGVEVMLVSSRRTRRWLLPKGWPMKGLKPHAAAAREALEEAGLVGKIDKQPVGSYDYMKEMKNGAMLRCHVTVFPMRVERQRKHWLEQDQRTTRWFSIDEAAAAVNDPGLEDVIRGFEQWIAGQPALLRAAG